MQQSIFDNRETFMKMMAVVTGLKRLQSLSRIFLGPEANSALKKWVFTGFREEDER
jgi:hypothetical protein